MQKPSFRWLYILFFLSGFPPLIYQIVWQRTLLAMYGVDVVSVTIVVSAFMLGLGIGSIAGGRLSEVASSRLLLFGVAELGIATYGIASPSIFHWAARFTAGAPPLETGLLSFALVLAPTTLMGATLPLLVAQLVTLTGHVGRSVAVLYFVNTLGSATACFIAALITMPWLGMSGSITVAAALNALVGGTVFILHFRWRDRATSADGPVPASPPSVQADSPGLASPIAVALAALIGFMSLSYEIVWYRLYSFAAGGPAQCFAYVLGAFLGGIAFGSLVSHRVCHWSANAIGLVRSIATLVLVASLIGFAIVPTVAQAVTTINYLWTLPLVAVTAGMLGATFPLICHVSIVPNARAGGRLSYLYVGNILGSVAGSWFVGFILFDFLSLRWVSVFLALFGIALAAGLLAASRSDMRRGTRLFAVGVGMAAVVVISSGPLFADVYRKMEYKRDWTEEGAELASVNENRSGVITVDADDAIFGDGAFDGWVETDPHVTDSVIKPLALSFFHPDPEAVLIVGLSGGAWAEVIANHPQVRKVTIVEINPGYAQVIRQYPVVAPRLTNPKVEFVIDDGRRWMFQHRDRKFDMIVMDTIYHWRTNATNLLSAEFLDLARDLLKPGGVLYYNTTFSEEAQRTGAVRFPYAYRFGIFMAVSDSPILVSKERWRDVLLAYRLEGRQVFDPASAEDGVLLREILGFADMLPGSRYDPHGMESRENLLHRTRDRPIVTDDNMITEWRSTGQ